MKRALLVASLTVVCSGASATGSAASKPGCNGLLAFASNRIENANPQIYAVSLDGSRTNLSHRPLLENESPAPSPDGRRVAFRSGGQLVVADGDGSHTHRFRPPGGSAIYDGQSLEWAPDSGRLVLTALTGYTGQGSGKLVAVLDVNSGTWTTLDDGWAPRWSPDGSTIAFVGLAPGNVQMVFVARRDGSDRRAVAATGGAAPIWSPDGTRLLIGTSIVPIDGAPATLTGVFGLAWTPDGTRVLGSSTAGGLASMAADGGDLRVIAKEARLGEYGRHELISPDGHLVVFARADSHVVVADLDGRVVRDFGAWPPPPQTFWQPQWSPDSSKILLWSDGKVLVSYVKTGETRLLAMGPTESPGQPVWSADGSSVLDAIADTSGNTDIYVAKPDGTGVRRVYADRAPESGPAWSPDGKRLAFLRYGSPTSLVVADLHGHSRILLRTRLINPADTTFYSVLGVTGLGPPTWSADGRTIAVGSSVRLQLVDARTGKTHGWGAAAAYPAFSPNGRRLAFAMPNTAGGEDVVVASVHGRRSTWWVRAGKVWDDQDSAYEGGLVRNLTWSPDGRRLAFTRFGVGPYGEFGDSTRVLDTHTHRIVATSFSSGEALHWSPDGRFVVQGGTDTLISSSDGRLLTSLAGLRAVDPSWQPLCKPRPATP